MTSPGSTLWIHIFGLWIDELRSGVCKRKRKWNRYSHPQPFQINMKRPTCPYLPFTKPLPPSSLSHFRPAPPPLFSLPHLHPFCSPIFGPLTFHFRAPLCLHLAIWRSFLPPILHFCNHKKKIKTKLVVEMKSWFCSVDNTTESCFYCVLFKRTTK